MIHNSKAFGGKPKRYREVETISAAMSPSCSPNAPRKASSIRR